MKLFLSLLLLFATNTWASSVDLAQSSLKWKGTKVTGEHFGEIKFKSAELKMKDGSISSGTFVVDMNSVDVTDLTGEWKGKFLAHMKSADFFKTEEHPTSTLVVKSDDGKVLKGDLSIMGQTHPIEVPYTKKDGVYTGSFQFDRTKYGIKYGSGNFFKNLGDKMIHNEVTITFNVTTK